ncbi:MAG: MarR family winged helix-turn-helix transcriptional regulator, partial [Gemmatimonadota bacterium]
MKTHEQVAVVRRFNRLVTQRAGALEDHFLGRARPLGHSRVLYEVGSGTSDVRDLRSLLGLDSGYLSRIVQALASDGLLEVTPAPEDERVRRLHLSAAGSEEVAEMERRSDQAASAILAGLTSAQRERLATAMEEVRRLLLVAALRIEAMHPDSPPARLCVDQYYQELERRFDGGFDPGASLPAPASELVPPEGVFFVAVTDGRPVGCGALKRIDGDVGSIKRMWVSGDA